ncbi:hypothetical protein [Luteolibacter sp. Populi]|uniref:hypothetical protein n=1 Tax=Luteolibacter sp. Populi TaxID=3230487 RepID=UPI003467D6F0
MVRLLWHRFRPDGYRAVLDSAARGQKLGAAEGKIGVLTARAAATGEKLAASGLPGKALANGAGFAGRSTATIGTEVLQNVTPDVWKSVTHALHQDIKGADWDTVLARERAALGDTALLSMGLVVAFGTGRRALDFIGEGELRTLLTDRRGLLEQGLSPVDVEGVVETAQYSPAEAADLAKQAADTTPVEERRERVRISWEEMMHEQQQVQTQLAQQRQMQRTEQDGPGEASGEDPSKGDGNEARADFSSAGDLLDPDQVAGQSPSSEGGKHRDPNQPESRISPIDREGRFEILDWDGYFESLPKPQGPLTVIEEGYEQSRAAANRENKGIRRKQNLRGKYVDIHEIQPVKFGGSPVDPNNKIILDRDLHRKKVTPWWNGIMREFQRKKEEKRGTEE